MVNRQQREEIVSRLRRGLSIRDISAQTGISYAKVWTIAEKYKIYGDLILEESSDAHAGKAGSSRALLSPFSGGGEARMSVEESVLYRDYTAITHYQILDAIENVDVGDKIPVMETEDTAIQIIVVRAVYPHFLLSDTGKSFKWDDVIRGERAWPNSR